jgi:uncharacterized protein
VAPDGPGWYPDPWQWWGTRWWDGRDWTGFTFEAPITEAPPPPPPIPTFPLIAAAHVVAILAVSLLVEKFAVSPVLDAWSLVPAGVVAAVGVLVVYLPSLLYCLWAARRWGSGNVLADLGLQIKGADIPLGFLTWVGAIIGIGILRVLIASAGIPFTSNVGGGGGSGRVGRDRSIFLIGSLIAVVVAPFVEELVFRGLVLRSLRSRLAVLPSVLIQGILFGCAHADVRFGAGNIGLLMVLSTAGVALGAVATIKRRNGTTMIAHAFMNGFVFLLLYAGSHAGGG